MGDTQQPFTEYAKRSKRSTDAAKLGWIVAGVAIALMVVFVLLWAAARVNLKRMAGVQTQLEEAGTNLANAQLENQKRQDQIAALQTQVNDLQKEKELAAQMAKGLENEMRTELESKDVAISKLQGKLTVSILDRIMFDSGEAILKPDGEAVMQKIGAILAKHPELKIHVIGHTDNVPIRAGARSRFASNWELSMARALAAVHCLTERAGVDPRRVGAVGYGEFRPVADNATPEGRAKNRRIAITILPDELAGADTLPAVQNSGSTNAPPVPAAP